MEWVLRIFHFSENVLCDEITSLVQTIQARFTQCVTE